MPKPATYTPREQEVLDAPDGYTLKVYLGPRRGWWERDACDIEPGQDSLETARQFVRLFRKANPTTGVLCYAYREIQGQRRVASVDVTGWR